MLNLKEKNTSQQLISRHYKVAAEVSVLFPKGMLNRETKYLKINFWHCCKAPHLYIMYALY